MSSCLILFTPRAGSAFLAYSLDNHPQIGCEHGEPLNETLEPWHHYAPKVPCLSWLRIMLNRSGYDVCACRVNYRIWRRLTDAHTEVWQEPDKIIHLWRENVVRVLVSSIINTRGIRQDENYEIHVTEHMPIAQVRIAPDGFIDQCDKYLRQVDEMREAIDKGGTDTHWLTYARLVGGEGREASQIPQHTADELCDFLGVERQTLGCRLKRTNPEPLSAIVENWEELRAVIARSSYAWCLEEEREHERQP